MALSEPGLRGCGFTQGHTFPPDPHPFVELGELAASNRCLRREGSSECSEARPSLPSGQDHPPAQCEGSVLASRSSESWSPTTRAASEILVGVASQTRLRKATKIISVQSVAIVRPPREAAVLPEKLFP